MHALDVHEKSMKAKNTKNKTARLRLKKEERTNPSLHVRYTNKAKPTGPETVTFSLLSCCSPKLFLPLSHDVEFGVLVLQNKLHYPIMILKFHSLEILQPPEESREKVVDGKG